jgi:hypothetical protein
MLLKSYVPKETNPVPLHPGAEFFVKIIIFMPQWHLTQSIAVIMSFFQVCYIYYIAPGYDGLKPGQVTSTTNPDCLMLYTKL